MDEEFWKPKDNLKQQISDRLKEMGGIELAQTCVDSFFAIEGAKYWKPEGVLLREVSYVIDIGLVLSIIGNNSLPYDYRQKINEAVKLGSNLPPNLWSELLVAALLKYHDADIQFVPRSTSKTPDLRVSWKYGNVIDVEVTRAEVRLLHKSVQDRVHDFVQTLTPSDVDWHLVCFVSDASNQEILTAAFDAAVELVPGQRAEETGLWYVEAVPLPERDKIVGGQYCELFRPKWWLHDEPAFFSVATFLNGKGNPVVRLSSLLPRTSYLNPIMRKANHGQHTEGRPYVIALDASDLPSASNRLLPDIEGNFPIWKHVSGILILSPIFYTTSRTKELMFRVFSNPYADYPMPNQLIDFSNCASHKLEFKICQK